MRIDVLALGLAAICFVTSAQPGIAQEGSRQGDLGRISGEQKVRQSDLGAVVMEDRGASEADVEAIHDELRALRKGLTDAIVAGDVNKQLGYATKDVVITWQNGETVRGRQAVKEFLLKNQGAASKVFQGYKKLPEPTDLTILYGDDAGISHGTSVARYKLLGKEFELENHWTATLVKENGRWLIASYHVSANILDNPLLNGVKSLTYMAGGVAFVVGLALGWLVFRNRERAAAPPAA